MPKYYYNLLHCQVLQKSFNYVQTNDASHLLELQMTKERQQYELTIEV